MLQSHGADAGQDHLVVGCSIFDSKHHLVRQYPGDMCRFMSDGRLILRDNTTIKLYDQKLRVVWTKRMHNHHLLNLTHDRRILVSSSVVRAYHGQPTRFDVLTILGLDGKIRATFNYFDRQSELRAKIPSLQEHATWKFNWDSVGLPEARQEYSHENSFYEIPQNSASQKDPAFAAGNFIVNDILLGHMFILDSSLKRILWSMKLPSMGMEQQAHDVQVLPNGHLLVYQNRESKENTAFSSLEEYDPIQKKTVWHFVAQPRESFNSPICGGVQLLANGHILYSDTTHRNLAIEIDRAGKEYDRFQLPPDVDTTENPSAAIQDAKREDLTEFLSLNQGI